MVEALCTQQKNSANSPAAIHIYKGELLDVLLKVGKPYLAATVKQICNPVPRVTFNFRSDFGGSHRKQSLKIPHDHVSEDQLSKIDSWKCIVVDDSM